MAGQDPGSPEICDGKEMVGNILALERAALLRGLTKRVVLAKAIVLAQALVQWEEATLVFPNLGCLCNVCLTLLFWGLVLQGNLCPPSTFSLFLVLLLFF